MADLGTAYINIVPKAQGIEASVKKLLGDAGAGGEEPGRQTGAHFLSGFKGVVAAAAIGKVVKDAFDAGGALQQSFGGLDTLYGDAAEGAKAYAMAAAEAGISANSYAEQAVSFGAALKAAYGGDTQAAMEAANSAILDMADNAAKMGTPLASIQAAYQSFARGQYTLLDNLKLGYGGTKNEMQRLLADAEKLTGVKYDIDNLGDVYNAIHVIQEGLGLTGVAADEAKTTLTGSFGAMKAAWTNLMAAMTTGEGMTEAFGNLSTSVGDFTNNVLSMLSLVAGQVPEMVSGVLNAVIANAPNIAAGGVELIIQLAVGFVNAIPQMIEKIPELFSAVYDAVASQDWASVGQTIINAVWEGMQSIWGSIVSWFNEQVSSLSGTAYIDVVTRNYNGYDETGADVSQFGHHKTGLDFVPYDNYPALLHEGEFIAPAGLAAQLRAAGINKDTKDLSGLGNSSQGVTQVNINFEGSLAQLARVLQPVIEVETDHRGDSLIR